jgi:hypothetical protein
MILNWRLVVLLKGLMAILPEPPGWNTKLYPMCLQIGTKEHEKLSTCIGVALLCENQGFFSQLSLLITHSSTGSLELVSAIYDKHVLIALNTMKHVLICFNN